MEKRTDIWLDKWLFKLRRKNKKRSALDSGMRNTLIEREKRRLKRINLHQDPEDELVKQALLRATGIDD